MPRKYLSLTECAQRKGVSRASIHKAITRGDLAAMRVGRAYGITEEACDAYQPKTAAERGKQGAAARWGAKEDKPEE